MSVTDSGTVVIPLPPGMTEDVYWQIQNGSLHTTAVFSAVLGIVLWDFLTLMPAEFRLYKTKGIWNKPAPYAFIILRYSILMPNISAIFYSSAQSSHCEIASIMSWVGATLVAASGGLIFSIRVLAIWAYYTPVVLLVGTVYLLTIAGWVSQGAQDRIYTGPPTPLFTNCQFGTLPATSSFSYAASVLFDIVILVLTLIRIPRPAPSVSAAQSGVIKILYRDTIFYFVTVTFINITVLIMESLPSTSLRIQLLKPLFIPFSSSFTALMGSRLFINLRSADSTNIHVTHISVFRSGDVPDMTFGVRETMSRLVFADVPGRLGTDSTVTNVELSRSSECTTCAPAHTKDVYGIAV